MDEIIVINKLVDLYKNLDIFYNKLYNIKNNHILFTRMGK